MMNPPKPIMIRADELLVTIPEREQGQTFPEVPLLFDTAGEQVIVLLDVRSVGGPILTFALAPTTTYAVAMALMQMRARIRRAVKSQSLPSPRSK